MSYIPRMIHQFGAFELDLAAVELRSGDQVCHLEPQAFALLALLVENRERVVPKDEIIDRVWDGRIVSEAAIASRVKSVRQALGDTGKTQRFIRTIHGRGYRFVAGARTRHGGARRPAEGAEGVEAGDAGGGAADCSPPATDGGAPAAPGTGAAQPDKRSRPSLAVLPFRPIGDGGRYAALALAIPDELIAELSRLRWLYITARTSSFRLRAEDAEFAEIGELLRVRYCLWGTVEIIDRRIVVAVELVSTADGGIVWADSYSGRVDDVHAMREEIRCRVLTALEIRIPVHEAARARSQGGESLDAWSAYHLGLQHMYRFNRADNASAAALFQRAVALDPLFARAHAGLSFIHFQCAFMHYEEDLAAAARHARRCAERGLELDPLDPFVNFTMGRTYWLEGDLEGSLGWLERATTLSPHFAQGIYARAWSEALAARSNEARLHVDLAMRLSPLDPLRYAMLGTRAFTHMAVEEHAHAADWAERAARSPGAHVLIAMIAAAAHVLNRDPARALHWAANVRERAGNLDRNDFERAFPMKSQRMRTQVLGALRQLGF